MSRGTVDNLKMHTDWTLEWKKQSLERDADISFTIHDTAMVSFSIAYIPTKDSYLSQVTTTTAIKTKTLSIDYLCL